MHNIIIYKFFQGFPLWVPQKKASSDWWYYDVITARRGTQGYLKVALLVTYQWNAVTSCI